MGCNMIDAGMEMSNRLMDDKFDVNAPTAMIRLYIECGESERRMKAWLCLRLEAGLRAPFRMSNMPRV